MKTILVPTDFSKNANKALSYATSLAKKEKAQIILLHAFNVLFYSPDIPVQYYEEEIAAIGRERKKKLDKICLKVEKLSKVKCRSINKRGLAIDIILDTIEHNKIDLVVMGTKGASGIKEVLIGSNTAKIISKASCPVIAVPEKGSFKSIKKVTFATDYSASDVVILKKLVNIIEPFKAKINVLHIADGENTIESEEESMESLKSKVAQKIHYKYISYELLYSNEVEKRLQKYIKNEDVNLLAMSTQNRSLTEQLFRRSMTKKLAYHTKVPLLAFHHK